jgi:hypothetical protein
LLERYKHLSRAFATVPQRFTVADRFFSFGEDD